MKDSELLARCASADREAVALLYDRHATSVYGYALLITLHPGDAARVLRRIFVTLARSPEMFGTPESLRLPLLALTRTQAYAEKTRRDRTRFLMPPSYAVPSSPIEVESERNGLLAAEGFAPEDLALPHPPQTEPCAAWRPVPPSWRAIVLIDAADALWPARKFFRRTALWMVFAASIIVALLSDATAPELPASPPSPAFGGRLFPAGERRLLYDIIDGFKQEGRR